VNLSRVFLCVLAFVVLSGGARARPAFAAEAAARGAPLLVVVEAGPGAGCDAEAVRAAIAAELRTAVVSPTATPLVALAGPRADTLLVGIDRERIVVTWRGRGEHDLTRSVPAPVERAARLRVVAWLAGNVARDQLASLTLPTAPSPGPSAASSAEAPPVSPPPAPAPSTAPPAFAAGAAEPTTVVRADNRVEPAPDFPRWTLSVGVGAAVTFKGPWQAWYAQPPSTASVPWGPSLQVEAQRHVGRWFGGAALDVGPIDIHPFGAALLAGAQWVPGRVRLEASAGFGVEAFVDRSYCEDCSGPGYLATTHPRGYLRGELAASYPLSAEWDVLVQVDSHVTKTTRAHAAFGLGTVGVRMRLP
jgi:hypothetical protein